MSPSPPIPHPPGPAFVQTRQFFKDPFSMIARATRDHGDIFAVDLIGLGRWVFLGAPELVREMWKAPTDQLAAGKANGPKLGILLGLETTFTLDGDAQLARRRQVHPQLNGRRILAYVGAMRETTRQALAEWPGERPFALLPRAHRLSLDILMRAMFGAARPDRVRELGDLFDDFATHGLRSNLVMFPFLQWDLGPWSPWGKIQRVRRKVREAFGDEIRSRTERRELQGEGEAATVLGGLLEAGVGEDREALLQEVLTLLFAGHETTGAVITWCVECLFAHPEVLRQARAEIEEVVGAGDVTAQHLDRLVYLEAVINESIRYRPIAPMAGLRHVERPFAVGGYVVPAGCIVSQCFPAMCQRKELFARPDQFDPKHFYQRKLKPFEWNPFGGGTRMCTGRGFAEVELKVVLATLLQEVDIRLLQERITPVRHGFFFGPDQGLQVVMTRRT